ncbi:MAG: DegT/DnrJ/EryC1/StrS family aminotransferase [Pseudomonadota bacterium]
MIGFLDLGAATRELKDDVHAAVARVVDSGWYVGGPELTRFEGDWAAYCGAAHCVGVANGLDALHLALRAVGVGPGDEVIVASNGYIATQLAVTMAGATPVPVEPDPATHNLDPARIEAAITAKTKAILPTHLYGQPADLDAIGAVAEAHALLVIDDAAQAHGAAIRGRKVGGSGAAITCWSFYPSKNLGALGDGGAVTTDDPELAARVRRLGNYGSDVRYVNQDLGVNSRLDPIQAAVLGVKLGRLDQWNQRRAAVAAFYQDALADCDGLTLPHVPNWADPAWHLYVVATPDRDRLAARLAEAGVQTLIHYPIPPHRQQAYAAQGLAEGSLPIAESLAGQVLSLPIGPHLGMDNAARVADAVRGAL